MDKGYLDNTPDERLASSLAVIRERYDLNLTWVEKASLRACLRSCENLYRQGYLKDSIEGAAIHLFLLDNFGLDSVTMMELAKSKYRPNKPEEFELWLNDIEHERDLLQEHIRNNVSMWRDERELI